MDRLQFTVSSFVNSYDLPRIGETLSLTGRILSVWVLVSATEWIKNMHLFRSGAVFDWRILSLRRGPITSKVFAPLVATDYAPLR